MPLEGKVSGGIFFTANSSDMKLKATFFLVWIACTVIGFSQTTGPKNGKLMIVGGGAANPLIKTFVELSGGSEAKIVVIPTAGTDESFPEDWGFKKLIEEF